MTHKFKQTMVAQIVVATLCAANAFSMAAIAQENDGTSANVPSPSSNQNNQTQSTGPDSQVEVVEVTGIRASLAENLNRKRFSDTFTDSIVAEDIGKLPDDNLAETLQRVAGVQIEKEDGEGVNVTIRGIRQNRIEVNGRTLISPFGRGTNRNLMNYFPSEIVRSVSVDKVLTADMTDGALGGTINITTRKPLDRKGLWGGASVEGSHADLNGDQGIKFSSIISDSFLDNTFGLSLGLVYEDRDITEDRFSTNGDWRQTTKPFNKPENFDAAVVSAVPVPYYYAYDLRYQRKQEMRDNTAVTLAAQWLPTNNLSINADILWAESNKDRTRVWVGAILDKELDDDHVPGSWVFSEDDSRVAGEIQTGVIQQNLEGAQQPENFVTGGLNASYDFDNGAKLFLEVAHTSSENKFDQQYVQLNNSGNSFSYDFRNTAIPEVQLPDLSNKEVLTGAVVYDRRTVNMAEETAFRVDLDYPLDGIFTAVKAGARISNITAERHKIGKRGEGPLVDGVDDPDRPFFTRDFSTTEVTSFNRMKIRSTDALATNWAQDAFRNFDLTDILPGAGLSNLPSSMWAIDPHLIGSGGLGFTDVFYDKEFERLPWEDSTVEDKINSAYVRADFELAGWVGNIGMRYAKTTTDVDKFAQLAGEYEKIVQSGSYSDWLPSFILKRDLAKNLVLRLGASKTITRPRTSNYQNADRINLVIDDPSTPDVDESDDSTASLANANLLPQRGSQADVSLEWYFAKSSALAVAAFYKDISNQVISDGYTGTIPGFGEQIFSITSRVNGEGGKIKGFEVAYQHNFSNMPFAWLDNTGTSINYTYLNNKTDEIDPRTDKSIGIQGVSTNSVNIQLFYEDKTLSARLLYNWRDEYFDRLDPFTSSTAITNRGEPSLSAAVRYKVMDNVVLELQAVNLLDNPKKDYALNDIAQYAETGRRYSLGINYKF